jgi:peptidyl-dipeptidase Dcp
MMGQGSGQHLSGQHLSGQQFSGQHLSGQHLSGQRNRHTRHGASLMVVALVTAGWLAAPAALAQGTVAPAAAAPAAATVPLAADNPFAAPWTLAHGAIPFDRIKTEHFKPAFDAGMAKHKAEIAAIASQKAAPTFANTIEALEKAGDDLRRVQTVFGYLGGSYTNPAHQALEREIGPIQSKHFSDISLNPDLFARIESVHQRADALKLNPVQKRLAERYYTSAVRAGAKLTPTQKVRVTEIGQRLSTLYTNFGQNTLADEKSYMLVLNDAADMAGLPDDLKSAAAEAAKRRGKDGQHVITLSRSLIEPFLTYSSRRDLRETAFKAWAARGNNGGATDNNALIPEILALRLERARLLGYETFAHFRTADVMAQTPERAMTLMKTVWDAAITAMAKDRVELEALAKADGLTLPLEAWDWRYYAEKVRKAKHSIDESEIKPYLQLDKMIEAKFYTANRLFGVNFKEVKGFPVYVPEVRTYEVTDSNGKFKAFFYADHYARPEKRSGAWASALRPQQHLTPTTAVITNNNNFAKGPDGVTLLSFDDAETLFHEFGHALHGIMSDVPYPRMAGTAVDRDFVEFPSQVFERWFSEPEILSKFATHYKTGQPMPKELIDRILAARSFNQGWSTIEYLGSAIVDMEFHLQKDPKSVNPQEFEKATLAKYGMPRDVIMRHRTTHFGHTFSGEGYAAGYYTYLWSDQLGADGYDAFRESGNVFDPAVSKRFLDYVYAAGNTRGPEEAYIGFRGRLPTAEPLLRARGFLPPVTKN